MDNHKEIIAKINSGDPDLIAEAVKEVQENGNLTVAEVLLQNLENIQDQHLTTIIVNLLADIKDNGFREVLISKIQTTTLPKVKSELIRIAWESSLDYAPYLEVFLDILLHDDFNVAFEASTAIENMVHQLTEEQQHALHHFMETFPEDKHFLIENIHEEMGCCED